jgi:hypothetical protein
MAVWTQARFKTNLMESEPRRMKEATRARFNSALRLDDLSALGCLLLIAYIMLAVSWCRRYNPGHLLWFCDIAVLLTAIGLLLRSRMLLTAQLTGVIFYHALWNIDFWSALTLGYAPIGSTTYMFYAELGLFEKSLSLFTHVFIVPVAFFGALKLGVAKKAWLAQWAQTFLIFLCTYLFTAPEENINRLFGVDFLGLTPASVTPVGYYALMITLPPLMIYLPTNRLVAMMVGASHHKENGGFKSSVVSSNSARPFSATPRSSKPRALSAFIIMLMAATFSAVISNMAHKKYNLDQTIFQIARADLTGLEDMPQALMTASVSQVLFGDRDAFRQAPLLVWPHPALPKQWSGSEGRMRPHTKSALLEIKADDIPSVPQEVWLRGARSVPGSAVWAVVVSDDFYAQAYCDLRGNKKEFETHCKMGGRGLSEFMNPATGEMYASTSYNEILGNGTGSIYALGVIETLDGKVVARSPFYLVKRKGIFFPEDSWLAFKDGLWTALMSDPGNPSNSRFAFQSPSGKADGSADIYTCDFFGYKARNLTRGAGPQYRLFTGSTLIDGVGWINGDALQCYAPMDGKSSFALIEDAR